MKRNVKSLLALVMAVALAASMLSVVSYATTEPELIAEGTASFETDSDAFTGELVSFTTETNGEITLEILSCTPGYIAELWGDGEWIEDAFGSAAGSHTFEITGGVEYEILLQTATIYSEALKLQTAGNVSYRISFLSNGKVPGGEGPTDPSEIPGATQDNPKIITGTEYTYLAPGQTVWYLYDNYQNMVDNGVYSMMLHVTSSADYQVSYGDNTIESDEGGFVNYKMEDLAKQGQYLFSVTNNSQFEDFFSISVAECLNYVNTEQSLKLGPPNSITLDSSVEYTLYSFKPTKTGIYKFTVTAGLVSNWGTAANPVDNTPDKSNTLTWTCTAVGQSVMIGFSGATKTNCIVARTGDYVEPEAIPWTFYEATYDFSYQMPENAVTVDVDLTDGGSHQAVLGSDGFYHYGNVCGPLMVADLSTVEIDIADAIVNGGLRVWIQDGNGNTITKVDYNEAMNTYLKEGEALRGLVPVTQELAMMLQELGESNNWWHDEGLVFPGAAPADLSIAWMQMCGYLEGSEEHLYEDGVCIHCGEAEPVTGVTVSGCVTTGKDGDTTVELIAEGNTVASTTVSGETGTYTLEKIAAGTYTVKVSKADHVTREYELTVGSEAVALDVKIHLLGDINGDGRLNTVDVSKIYAHARKTTQLTDYELLCADISGDGRVNTVDTSKAYAHARKTATLW